jgi:uncharacterized coiled-coil DUF342 family protein
MPLKIQPLQIVKTNYKKIIYTIIAAIAIYGTVWIATREPRMPKDMKATIDSLTKANAAYQEKQNALSESIDSFKTQVNKVDFEIDNIKEKTTVVKEYHHEIIEKVDHYDPTEIESFFKQRYNY